MHTYGTSKTPIMERVMAIQLVDVAVCCVYRCRQDCITSSNSRMPWPRQSWHFSSSLTNGLGLSGCMS